MIPKILVDVFRHLLTLGTTACAFLEIWHWHWLAALVALVPIYIVALNVFGFATLPLYLLTAEARRLRQMKKELFESMRNPGSGSS